MANKMTQNTMLLEYLIDNDHVTAKEAENELGIMRTASRVSDLKKMGYDIESARVRVPTRYGDTTIVAEYRYHGEKPWWIFTFGTAHEHGGKYVKFSGSFRGARKKMVQRYGTAWAFQYSEKEWEDIVKLHQEKGWPTETYWAEGSEQENADN